MTEAQWTICFAQGGGGGLRLGPQPAPPPPVPRLKRIGKSTLAPMAWIFFHREKCTF